MRNIKYLQISVNGTPIKIPLTGELSEGQKDFTDDNDEDMVDDKLKYALEEE